MLRVIRRIGYPRDGNDGQGAHGRRPAMPKLLHIQRPVAPCLLRLSTSAAQCRLPVKTE